VFDTVMVNDDNGEEHPTHAVFVELVEGEKIVFTEPDVAGGGMTTSLVFKDLGNGTCEVVMRQTNVPELYRSPEALAGMQTAFDKCAVYVKQLAQAA
jgi:hypothetical protein